MVRSRFRRATRASTVLSVLMLMATACAPAVPSARQTPVDPTRPHLPLWEVTGGAGTVYLLGSVHLLRPEVYPLDNAIYAAFDAADVVAFELDFAEMMASAPVMMERGTYDDGRTLAGVLPAATYTELAARVAEVGLPMAIVDPMKPWLAAMTLSSLVLQRGGYDAATGIDLHFHGRATDAGKEILGLETMDEQIEVFEGLDTEAQIAFLESTLDQLDDTVAELDEATARWQRGDAHGLAEMFVESVGDQPQLMERLLFERNRNWIPQIEALLASPGTAIVIVGMGHLVGAGSVIELLTERDHVVRQLQGHAPAPADGR